MGGKQRQQKKKVVEKKVKDPMEKIRRKPWLLGEPTYLVTRFMWDAKAPGWTYAVEDLTHPVTHVVLNYHSRFPACSMEKQCVKFMQLMQRHQCELMRYQDLAYNWYIGGDGRAYEGRGWMKHPKLQHELSPECIEIAYMGDFPINYDPPEKMVKVFHEVVKYGIEKKYIKEDYELHEFRAEVQPSNTMDRQRGAW